MRAVPAWGLLLVLLAAGSAAAKGLLVEAHDSYFTLAGDDAKNPDITVERGATVALTLVQRGAQPHNWVVREVAEAATAYVEASGSTAATSFVAPAVGTYAYVCEAHAPVMAGTLRVVEPGEAPEPPQEAPGVGAAALAAGAAVAAILARRR